MESDMINKEAFRWVVFADGSGRLEINGDKIASYDLQTREIWISGRGWRYLNIADEAAAKKYILKNLEGVNYEKQNNL